MLGRCPSRITTPWVMLLAQLVGFCTTHLHTLALNPELCPTYLSSTPTLCECGERESRKEQSWES